MLVSNLRGIKFNMKKLQIKKVNNYEYTLIDKEKEYILNIEFYDIEKPNIGDYIYLPNKILEENILYSFGPIKRNAKDEEYIKLDIKGSSIYLQRYYG
jgi:hypothetical protein